MAAAKGRLDIIRIIREHYPDDLDLLNQKDKFGQTPLLWAASRGHNDVVEYLVSIPGIDLNAATHWPESEHHGKTSLDWASSDAVRNTLVEAIQLLRPPNIATKSLPLTSKDFQFFYSPVARDLISDISGTRVLKGAAR